MTFAYVVQYQNFVLQLENYIINYYKYFIWQKYHRKSFPSKLIYYNYKRSRTNFIKFLLKIERSSLINSPIFQSKIKKKKGKKITNYIHLISKFINNFTISILIFLIYIHNRLNDYLSILTNEKIYYLLWNI